jgi:hypothetical protein
MYTIYFEDIKGKKSQVSRKSKVDIADDLTRTLRGKKYGFGIYVVTAESKSPKDVFITGNIWDVELWFANIHTSGDVYIKIFPSGNYKAVMQYLAGLYD